MVAAERAAGFIFPAIILGLWASGQFKWLFDIVNFFFILIVVVPVVGLIALNLWVKTSIVNGECPSCNAPSSVVKGQQSICLNCGTPIQVENGKIERISVYSQAVEVDERTGKKKTVDVVDVDVIEVDARDVK
eukprot:CAMPEP_0206239090 /NCGR_PEP_ID=MMETSP0047_2-20121206/15185_1 /ASSEMBLY_ACC=CAM_ASM_000192 /TAXON_ID=195065 /ORGANISM="Chroomonas mesostigmatica_cf, Strain CCMP1168" /LENGTH=132 /DNA_ID=CAMNT_0053663713 /DNA_START=204 /DNA_END=603 /DNA_ORIENTATION=-